MSLILVLDTVTKLCSCALYQYLEKTGARITCLARLCDTVGKGHGEHLLGQIDMLLRHSAIDKKAIARIGVNIGPGSFTGMRVGVAAARGLALATQATAIGVSRFEAIDHAVRQKLMLKDQACCIIFPAVQNRFYGQIFLGYGKTTEAPFQATADEIVAKLSTKISSDFVLSGSGAPFLTDALKSSGNFSCNDFQIMSTTSEMECDAIATLSMITTKPQKPPSPLYMRAAL